MGGNGSAWDTLGGVERWMDRWPKILYRKAGVRLPRDTGEIPKPEALVLWVRGEGLRTLSDVVVLQVFCQQRL